MAAQLLLFPEPEHDASADAMPTLAARRVQRGDLWQLGAHRLLCGDATDAGDVARLMGGVKARMVVTSPPYSDQRTYTIGAFDWTALMCGSFAGMLDVLASDGQILINLGLSHKNRAVEMYWQDWLTHCAAIEWPLFGWYVWDKGEALPGHWNGRYAPSFEFIFHFARKTRRPAKLATAKGGNRDPKTVRFRYPDGTLRAPRSPDKVGQNTKIPNSVLRINREYRRGIHTQNHPAVYPPELPDFLMRSWSDIGDAIYEPFCGAGTTLIAAEQNGRHGYGMEIEPHYCDIILRRWEQMTGKRAALIDRLSDAAQTA